jgi:pyruvate dehydrogenase E2 component (dihydrolipoamide acetyltransferase)
MKSNSDSFPRATGRGNAQVLWGSGSRGSRGGVAALGSAAYTGRAGLTVMPACCVPPRRRLVPQVPEFRVSMAIGTDRLDALYRKLKPKGVTMTALLAKACGVALEQHPLLYSVCTPDGSGVTYNERINIAMAVAMPDGGLITPVLKDADSTDIYTLSRSWADLVKRARAKQLSPDEFTTGTFTVSNLGMFGVESFDAILPPGTSAILAVGGSKPVVTVDENGRIGVEKQMVVNITCDHRTVYGAHAAEFLQSLKAVIESPDQLVF